MKSRMDECADANDKYHFDTGRQVGVVGLDL